jgi:glycerophosphoryl diester phosphodiesterase
MLRVSLTISALASKTRRMRKPSFAWLLLTLLGDLMGCTTQPAVSTLPNDTPPPVAPAPDKAEHERLLVKPGLLIAHALGAIGGVPYTNSLEALQCNYKRGFRWFEVDLALTADNELVCFHLGHEELVGLKQPVNQLAIQDVEGKLYAGRYPVRRFRSLLEETDRLGDVVLVTDTKGWDERMANAVKLAFQAAAPGRRATRLALQSYGAQDIALVDRVGRETGSDILLTLYMSGADDIQVEALVKEYGVLAVVADTRRFSPWLAQRLDSTHVPVLVHTINEHRDILKLARAGADGFYTDLYRPYDAAATGLDTVECAAPGELKDELVEWVERDVLRPGDYALMPCAKRGPNAVELSECDNTAAIRGPQLAVPPHQMVRVQLDVEAGPAGTHFWMEFWQKNRGEPLRQREQVTLNPNERRAFSYEIALPEGSPGVETRLGVTSAQDRLLVHGLKISHASAPTSAVITSARQ